MNVSGPQRPTCDMDGSPFLADTRAQRPARAHSGPPSGVLAHSSRSLITAAVLAATQHSCPTCGTVSSPWETRPQGAKRKEVLPLGAEQALTCVTLTEHHLAPSTVGSWLTSPSPNLAQMATRKAISLPGDRSLECRASWLAPAITCFRSHDRSQPGQALMNHGQSLGWPAKTVPRLTLSHRRYCHTADPGQAYRPSVPSPNSSLRRAWKPAPASL